MKRIKLLSTLLVLCCCKFPDEGYPLTAESSSSSSDDGTETFAATSAATSSSSHGSTAGSSSEDPSAGSSSEESSGSDDGTSESTTEESSSTGEPVTDYASCSMPADPSCSSPADTCIWTDGVMDEGSPGGWCARECNSAVDCPWPESGTADPDCTYYGELPLKCILRCDVGQICPDGMVCREYMFTPEFGNQYDHVCAWSAR
jgi:hypothetical protein